MLDTEFDTTDGHLQKVWIRVDPLAKLAGPKLVHIP